MKIQKSELKKLITETVNESLMNEDYRYGSRLLQGNYAEDVSKLLDFIDAFFHKYKGKFDENEKKAIKDAMNVITNLEWEMQWRDYKD